MRCVYLVIWVLALCIEAKKYGFLLGTEGWTASGYGSVDHRAFTIHSHRDGPSLSHYILGKEERVNVDAQNRNDKDLWYFQSPPIVLGFRPTLLMFTMMSFSGDFRQLNRVQALARLRFDDGVVAGFPVYQSYDGQSYDGQNYNGSSKTFYVQFIEELWISNSPNIIYDGPNIIYDAPNSYALLKDSWYKKSFRLEILGDWTQGWETIGLDNVEII
jgi:hypothetical protein